MTALRVLLLFAIQFLIGLGLLHLLDLKRRPAQNWALGVLLGLPASTLVIFLLDVIGIRLTWWSVLVASLAAAAAVAHPLTRHPWRLQKLLRTGRPKFQPCEIVFLLFVGFCVLLSIWRCYYIPVTNRDNIGGSDLVARYAAEQGTIHSSIFTDGILQGELSNQPFYAPFTALMQIGYRLAGLGLGKLWLSFLFVAFLLFLYDELRQRLHPALAGLLLVVFVAGPEMYGYTFSLTIDFSNALFFGMSVYFFHEFRQQGRQRDLLCSALFLGFACWTRSETILLAPFGALLAALGGGAGRWRAGADGPVRRRSIQAAAWFLAVPLFLFALWHLFYLRLYLHQAPENQIVFPAYTLQRIGGIVRDLARLAGSTYLYGYVILLFAASLLANGILYRGNGGGTYLIWTGLLLLGFVLMSVHFPAVNADYTIKRGFFKFIPLVLFYLAETKLWRQASEKLRRWEMGTGRASSPQANA